MGVRQRLLFAAIVAAGLIGIARLWRTSGVVIPSDEVVLFDGARAGLDPLPAMPVTRREAPADVPAGWACVRVLDQARRPIPDAMLALHDRAMGWVTIDALERLPPIARSDSTGLAVIKAEFLPRLSSWGSESSRPARILRTARLDSPGLRAHSPALGCGEDGRSLLVIFHPAHSPAALAGLEAGTTTEVILGEACRLAVEVVDTDGRGVGDVRVRLQLAEGPSADNADPAPEAMLLRPAAFGGPLFVATSDAAGIARFTRLAPCRYALTLDLGTTFYVLDDPGRDYEPVDVGRVDRWKVVIRQPLGCVVDFPGDEVLAHVFSVDRSGPWNLGWLLWLRRVTRVFERRFPGCLVYAQLPSRKPVDGEAKAVLQVGLCTAGWRRFTVALRPVSEIGQPEELQAGPGSGAGAGALVLNLYDPSGRKLPDGLVGLMPTGEGWHGVRPCVRVPSDRPLTVPPGSYRCVTLVDWFPRGILPRDVIRVASGQTTVQSLMVGASVFSCVFKVELPDGTPARRYSLGVSTARDGSGGLLQMEEDGDGERVFWFREGTIRYDIGVLGFEFSGGRHLVGPSHVSPCVIRVRVGQHGDGPGNERR